MCLLSEFETEGSILGETRGKYDRGEKMREECESS